MATFSSIFSPYGGGASTTADLSAAITGTSSTGEIILGSYALFAINGAGDLNIRFGNAGMPAASATDFRIPGGLIATYRMPKQYDRIRIFNAGASSISYWIQPLASAT